MRAGQGRTIGGRFELLERLGGGGMGTVWRARDNALHREVALKEVKALDPAVAAANPDSSRVLRERVLREARALARISHPHVVTIHHIVDEGPHPWIVMELLSGVSLQDRLAQGRLEPGEAAWLGRQVLAGLRAAHAAGIQHRDVKPANVMLRADGSAVLTDFGIAALHGSASITMTGDLIGSPEYIAPERVRGSDDNPASDLWSLGLVLYVCVEGTSPLRRATSLATLAAVLDEPVPPPVRSGALEPVLNALLVRDPSARPDAQELDRMLARAESGGAPDGPWQADRSGQAVAPTPPAAWNTTAQLPVPPPPTQLDSPRPTPVHGVQAPGPEYGTASAAEPRTPAARRRTPVIVAAVAVAVAVVAATALALTLRNSDGESTAGAGAGAGATDTSPTGPSDSPSPSDSSASTEPGWVVQLASIGKAKGVAARDRQEKALRDAGIDNVQYVDSDLHASLTAGYWVFYVPGFVDGYGAVDWCGIKGMAKEACFGRYVSDSAADRHYLCNPAADGSTTGRCTRS
nr:protein kinase [Streptomyces sp. NBC_00857]